ncbi:LysR family transcriptional regulator [Paraburkholderia silviterrae]|uniref:LysR family transcriptional regulator n=1 Tax=Paraburkholderia silviterrae TaxID=2528715 RepID=A0A4R5M2B0_9BURK|nr:LysR family transcriptional regulator [Paraburkholderia silviterrae]TDG19313.1 LysR family transcriptional regulator [Paraburkholderia silviterrae]
MNSLHQRLKLRHITVVVEIDRQGSLQKAAESLKISQSAVSKALAEIEAIVGAQLFERLPSGMRPTVYGETLVRHGHLISSDVQRAEAELEALLSGDVGNLSIGIFSPLAWWRALPECIGDFRAQWPRVRLALREGPMEDMLECLDQDLVDVVIGRTASGFGSELYKLDMLQQDAPVFLARQGHPLTQGPKALQDLLEYPWVLPAQPNIVRQQLEFAVRDMGLRFPSDVLSSQVSPVVLRLAGQSDSLVLSSQCIADELCAQYHLQTVQCALPLHIGPLVALTRSDKPPTRAAAAFLRNLGAFLGHGGIQN